MIKLDERLSAAASFVRLDKRICDVGTDHALLPCYLWERGARSVIASDINDGPLAAASETVKQYGCDGIELIKSDGLLDIPPCDDIIIAGMGGELIERIILGCSFITDDTHFILQPMTRAETLRRGLYKNGFAIDEEKGAVSAGRAYTVMLVHYTGIKQEISDDFAFFGKCSDKRYTEHVNAQLLKRSNGIPELKKLIRKQEDI